MTPPAVVELSGLNQNAATTAGGTGTVSFRLMTPISGQDGVVYAMASYEEYVMSLGTWSGNAPALRSTDLTNSLYQVKVELDDWKEVFAAPLPASVSTLAGMRALAVSDLPSPPAGYVPWALVGVAGGIATLDQSSLLSASERPPNAATYALGAGLLNATLLTDSGMSGVVTLSSGVYQNKIFNVTRLIMPNDNTILINCRVIANSINGVSLDANTGLETGRRLVNCEIINAGGRALAGAGFSAIRVLGKKAGDDFALVGRSHAEPTFLDGCACRDFNPLPAAHFDGVQIVTTPAAPVIIRDCDFNMNAESGWVVPGDAGSTGAIFVAYDVAIGQADPDPARVGKVYVLNSKLQSSTGNYTVVVSEPGVTVANCAIGSGTTGPESLTTGHVSGWGNTDLSGVPLVTDIHGSDLGDYLLAGDSRVASAQTFAALSDVNMTGVQDGQVPTWSAGQSKFLPATPAAGGGGSGGTRQTIVSSFITSGSTPTANTGGAWLPVAGTSRALAAVVGEQVAAEYSFTVDSQADTFYDIGVVVAGALVRLLHCPTFPPDPSYEGMAEYVPDNPARFIGTGILPWFIAASGDISGGNVTFCVARKSGGNGVFDMNDALPVRYSLYNNH